MTGRRSVRDEGETRKKFRTWPPDSVGLVWRTIQHQSRENTGMETKSPQSRKHRNPPALCSSVLETSRGLLQKMRITWAYHSQPFDASERCKRCDNLRSS